MAADAARQAFEKYSAELPPTLEHQLAAQPLKEIML
ncbi:MAG: hypothetical protein EZS28_013410, partial [Streblomastix strix]